jgi:AcrR family transcriptional regulator
VTPRTSRPRREEVRARLLEAAAAVVAERGVAAASLDAVAAAAGFTKGAVYSNFANKDELVLALLEDVTHRRVGAVAAAAREAGDLRAALDAVGAALTRPDPTAQLLLVEFWARAVRDPSARAAYVAARRRLHREVTAVVASFLDEHSVGGRSVGARSSGEPSPGEQSPGERSPGAQGGPAGRDPAALATVLLALGTGLALEAVPDPGAVPPGLVRDVLAALLGDATDSPTGARTDSAGTDSAGA